MENQKRLLDRLLDNLLDNLSQRSDSAFDARFNSLKEDFDKLHVTVKTKHKNSKKWGIAHDFFGFLSVLSSFASLVLTFSEEVTLIRICSLVAAFSMSFIFYFNPSKRESQLVEVNKFYQSMKIKISDWEGKLKSVTNDNLKENILKEFIDDFNTLIEMINEKKS